MTDNYKVNLDSVLNCQMDDYDYNVRCEDFDQAKTYVLDAFGTVIDRLTYLCEQIRKAEQFEDLDLGYWEPLFEEIEGHHQPAEDTTKQDMETSSECPDQEASNDR